MELLPGDSIGTTGNSLERGGEIRPAAAEPYQPFSLSNGELEEIQPLQALLADSEVAGYLNSGAAGAAWSPARLRRLGLGLIAFLALLIPLLFLPGWKMLAGYSPPPPADTPKPQAFAGNVTLAFRDRIRDINSDVQAGNRWRPAFEKLRALFDAGEEMPDDLRVWVDSELLVTLASKEIPPDAYDETLPDRVLADLQSRLAAEPGAVLPFRAAAAYAAVLHSLPASKENAAEREAAMLAILERLRSDHPVLMDKNRDLLFLEAQQHIAAFPAEYAPQDRHMEYHWRRAAHAIDRLYSLYGSRDGQVRGLDRRRWETVYKYFDFTLLTLDMNRLGRLKTIQLDGKDYSRDDIKHILEQL